MNGSSVPRIYFAFSNILRFNANKKKNPEWKKNADLNQIQTPDLGAKRVQKRKLDSANL